MTMVSRRIVAAGLAGAVFAGRRPAAGQGALGQASWPQRPVTVVVPFPAGASTDVVTRLVAEELRAKLGQSFLVENKVGAGGNIGAGAVVRSAPDGYTLCLSSGGPLSSNKLLYRSLSYDPLADFEPISLVGDVQCVIAVHRSVQATSLAELIAYGKANPGKLTFGSPGYGLMGHIAGELIQRAAGFRMTHVPYRGSAPLANDLVAGNVNVAIDFLPAYIPHVQAGSIRALAVTADQRAPQIPETPTLSEAGLGEIQFTSWYAMVGPKGLSQDIVGRLAAAVNGFVRQPATVAKLEEIGVRAIGGGPDEVRKAQAAEIAKWEGVIREAGIALQ